MVKVSPCSCAGGSTVKYGFSHLGLFSHWLLLWHRTGAEGPGGFAPVHGEDGISPTIWPHHGPGTALPGGIHPSGNQVPQIISSGYRPHSASQPTCKSGDRLSKKADLIAALSLEAFDGRIDPFMDCIQQIRPHRGQIETGDNFRKLLEGSEIITQYKAHVQDPYSFRCIPQVHGATKDAIRYVSSVLLTEINSVTDNPTIFPDEDRIISGGNFHGQPLAISYDFLGIALAELGNISERRVAQLIMGLRGLPEFLVANPGLNSGFMIPQYAAASMVSQNKMYCYAASSDSIVSSNGQEDHVSMGANAATKLYRIMDNLEHILSIELMNAAQGIEFRRPLKTSPALERFLNEYRKEVHNTDVVLYFNSICQICVVI